MYPPVTKKELLEKHSAAIFRRYFRSFEIGRLYKSPLRKEDNASFNIFEGRKGVLMYKDFGGSKGNAIDFVMVSKCLNFYSAIVQIVQDLNLRYSVRGLQVDTIKKEEEFIVKKVEKKYKLLPILFDKFTDTDYNYWIVEHKLKDLEIVKKHNVRSAQELSIGGIPIWGATRDNPIYIYFEKYEEEWYRKAYRPYGEIGEKWRCDYPDIANMVHGVDLLRGNRNDLIITKSVKDVIVLESLGFEAICVQSEDLPFPQGLLTMLKKWYEYIYVLFDNDFGKKENAGRKLSNKFAKNYNIKQIIIPREYCYTDVSELIKTFDKDTIKFLIEQWKI